MIVLLVEDDDELREMLEHSLAGEFDVRSCACGDEGLLVLHTEPVDVLLTDLALPGVCGEALAREAQILTPPVPVVAMSSDLARLEVLRPLVDAVVPKPSPLSAVKAALHRAARSD
jgi:DNA-binding response OmpR family regulator